MDNKMTCFIRDNLNVDSLSDQRFKENIKDFTDWSEPLMALRPVTFTWSSNAPSAMKKYVDDIGFIAQEVATAFPNAHDSRPLGSQMVEVVRYEKLVPLLVAALQDHQRRIEDLEKLIRSSLIPRTLGP
jgi:hypothetical protein